MKEQDSDQPAMVDLPKLVYDVETTMKCPVGNNKANPFWPENEVVMHGMFSVDYPNMPMAYTERGTKLVGEGLLIGHNLAFDLHYALRDGYVWHSDFANLQIWDTQLAEYLLSGQREKWPSLDDVALRRGGTLKDDRVSKMFKAGIGADGVPKNLLEDYLKGDLTNTYKVFMSQYAEATERNMLPLLWSQMDARQGTIEMVFNGLKVDVPFLEQRAKELQADVNRLAVDMQFHVATQTGRTDLDPTSPTQLSTVLFGGKVKRREQRQVGTFKNGKPKMKWFEVEDEVPGFALPYHLDWVGANGKVSTSDEVLSQLLEDAYHLKRTGIVPFLEDVQAYRAKSKELSTYFEGIRSLVMPDGLVHHNLNHCFTATGRLSSSEPNLQNITDGSKSDIKKAFVSRWGDDGVVLEADYSQLEMIVLAVLSGDKQMMEDIRTGTDMHSALYKDMYGVPLPKEKRKKWKRCSFALVYGAGAGGIAQQSGLSKQEAKQFIDTFYTRYPGVAMWHDITATGVASSREYHGDKDGETGLPIGRGYYTSPVSNRLYCFREYAHTKEMEKWKGRGASFSPTEIKNYPVQGTATGDVVPLVVGRLFRVLRNNPRLKDKCLMVNTVHDSIMFDVHRSVLDEAIRVIKSTMESAPALIKETFGYEFPLALPVGISYGPNWMEQKEVDFSLYERIAA